MGGAGKTNPEMGRLVDHVRGYWQARIDGGEMSVLSETIRQLRILLQETLTGCFLSLPLPRAREFRTALSDELHNACGDFRNRCSDHDHAHHQYCIREIVACFEWAEQIKEEIPEDPLTQKILAVDIPILRPFDYGVSKPRPIKRR